MELLWFLGVFTQPRYQDGEGLLVSLLLGKFSDRIETRVFLHTEFIGRTAGGSHSVPSK